MALKTKGQIRRENIHKKIAEEFIKMVGEGSAKTEVTEFLMEKYGYDSGNSIHRFRVLYGDLQDKKPAVQHKK